MRGEAETECVFRAVINAVHTANAFTETYAAFRAGSAFAAGQTEVAIGALRDDAIDSKQALAGEDTKQRAQWTDEPAEKARLPQVDQDEK